MSGMAYVRKGSCPEGVMSGRACARKGLCPEGLMSGRVYVTNPQDKSIVRDVRSEIRR